MPESDDQRAERLLAYGFQLAADVRDDDPAAYLRRLSFLDRAELEHLAVLLAACVEIDRAPGELLAWWDRSTSVSSRAAVPADVAALHAERFGLPLRGER